MVVRDVSTLLYLRNRTYNPSVGLTGDVPLTLLTSSAPDASKFRVYSRPDVTTALGILGSAQATPTDAHLQAVKKVLRYLHGTIDMRLTLKGGTDHSLQLTYFADADLENDNNTRKSRSGYLFTLGRGPHQLQV
jgi:hypothetical protein